MCSYQARTTRRRLLIALLISELLKFHRRTSWPRKNLPGGSHLVPMVTDAHGITSARKEFIRWSGSACLQKNGCEKNCYYVILSYSQNTRREYLLPLFEHKVVVLVEHILISDNLSYFSISNK
jgi:hypothetical protein